MPAQAPVVVRSGNVVVHVNDVSSLQGVIDAIARHQPPPPADVTPALAAHEEALAACRQVLNVSGIGAAAAELG